MRNEVKWFELGTEGYPIPLWDKNTDSVVWYEEDPNNPERNTIFLPTMKDVTRDQFYGEFMREVMCDPSLLPSLTDVINRMSKKTDAQKGIKSYNYTVMGDPGLGKTYVMSKFGELMHPRGAFKVDCHNIKDPKYLYQETSIGDKSKKDTVDAFLRLRAKEIMEAPDDETAESLRINQSTLAYMKSRLGNNAVTEEIRDGRRIVAIDWFHDEITQRSNPKEVDMILDEIIKRLEIPYEESNETFKVKEEDGPLIRALFDPQSPDYGRLLIADECNRMPEVDAWLTIQAFFSDAGASELKLPGADDNERIIKRDGLPETFMFLGTCNPPTEAMGASAQEMSQPMISRYGFNVDIGRCDKAEKQDYISRMLKHMTGVPAYYEYMYDPEYYDANPKELSERLWALRTVGLSKEEIKMIPYEEKFNIEHIDRTIKVAQNYGALLYEANVLVQNAKNDPELTEEYQDYLKTAVIDLRYCFKAYQDSKGLLSQPKKKGSEKKRRAKIGGEVAKSKEEMLKDMDKKIALREKNGMFVRGTNLDMSIGAKLRNTFLPQGYNTIYVQESEDPAETLEKMKSYAKKIETIAKGLKFEFAGYVGQDSVANLFNAKKEDFEVNATASEYMTILTESINRLYRRGKEPYTPVDLFDDSNIMQVLNTLAQDEETRGIIIPNYLEDAVEKAETFDEPFKQTYITSSDNNVDVSDLVNAEQFIDSMTISQTREHNIKKLLSKGYDINAAERMGVDIESCAKQLTMLDGSHSDVFTSIVRVNNDGKPGLAAIIYNKKSKRTGIVADFTLSEKDLERMRAQNVDFINARDVLEQNNKDLLAIDSANIGDILGDYGIGDRKSGNANLNNFIKKVTEGADDVSVSDVIGSFMVTLTPEYSDIKDDDGALESFCGYIAENDVDGKNPNIVVMTNVEYQQDKTFENALLLKNMRGR